MEPIGAVHLRGGPCDDQPAPLPGTTFPSDLAAITVMNHAAGIGHVYAVASDALVDGGVRHCVLEYRRTLPRDA